MLSRDWEELLLLFIGLVLMYIDRVHDNSTIKRMKCSWRLWLRPNSPTHYILHYMADTKLNIGLGGRYIFHWMYLTRHCEWVVGVIPECIAFLLTMVEQQADSKSSQIKVLWHLFFALWSILESKGQPMFVFPSKLLRHKSCMFEWDNWMGRGDHSIENVLSCLLKLLKWSFWTLSCPPDQTLCIGGSEIFDTACVNGFFLFLTWRVFQQNFLNPPHEYIFHGSSHAQSDQIEERPWHDWPMCNCGPCPAWWQCHLHGYYQ